MVNTAVALMVAAALTSLDLKVAKRWPSWSYISTGSIFQERRQDVGHAVPSRWRRRGENTSESRMIVVMRMDLTSILYCKRTIRNVPKIIRMRVWFASQICIRNLHRTPYYFPPVGWDANLQINCTRPKPRRSRKPVDLYYTVTTVIL